MAKLRRGKHGAQARRGFRVASWVTEALSELAKTLNSPSPATLSSADVEAIWVGWAETRSRLNALATAGRAIGLGSPRHRYAIDPLRRVLRRLAWRPDQARSATGALPGVGVVLMPEGTIRVGTTGPSVEDSGLWVAVEILDYAVKTGRPGDVLRRLHRCTMCATFFLRNRGNVRHEKAFCSTKCADAYHARPSERDRRRAQVHDRGQRRTARRRDAALALGFDAPPNRCIDPALRTPAGLSARVAALVRKGLILERAQWIASQEAERLEIRQ